MRSTTFHGTTQNIELRRYCGNITFLSYAGTSNFAKQHNTRSDHVELQVLIAIAIIISELFV